MSDPESAAEAPLDPATERVRRKLVRLLAVSIGIMFAGVMAVLAAVVYRMGDTAAIAVGATVPMVLPVAGEVVETSLDGGRLSVRIAAADGGAEEIVIFELATGTVLSRHPIKTP